MSKSIHVVPDSGRPEGGHAIIRLDGIWLLPEAATFRIEPLDDTVALDKLTGWPAGDRRPNDIRTTSRGIELLIGPEIVEAPDLLPGTPVSVSVPAAELDVEIRWPDLPLSRNLDLAVANGGRARSPIVAADSLKTRSVTTAAVGSASVVDSLHSGKPNGLAQLSRRDGALRTLETKPSAAERDEAANGSLLAAPLAANGAARMQPIGADSGVLKRPLEQAANDTGPATQPMATPTRDGRTGGGFSSPLLPLLGGLVVTAGLLAVVWFNLPGGFAKKPAEPFELGEIFVAGDTSPLGHGAKGVTRDQALYLANQYVHGTGGQPQDKAEAAFWLKKALSQQLSNEQMRWALTQLGSVYAVPGPQTDPNYIAARLVWELAGASGDPIALCFSGRLHEKGLGVPVDKEKARTHYERAQSLGGCPGLEAALSRVTE